jgi:hypothetical protein
VEERMLNPSSLGHRCRDLVLDLVNEDLSSESDLVFYWLAVGLRDLKNSLPWHQLQSELVEQFLGKGEQVLEVEVCLVLCSLLRERVLLFQAGILQLQPKVKKLEHGLLLEEEQVLEEVVAQD